VTLSLGAGLPYAIDGRISAGRPVRQHQQVGFTEFTESGGEVFTDVIKRAYDQTNEMFGTNIKPPVYNKPKEGE